MLILGGGSEGVVMASVSQFELNHNPFARDRGSPLRPVRAAFDQLMRHVELKTAVILVVGPAGSGKTFLLDMTEEACRGRGMSVLRIERGDLAHTVIGKRADLLLVDEADFIDEETLNIVAGHPETPKSVVFACRAPRGVGDIALPTLVTLASLTPNEARDFLLEQSTKAGRPDLFTPEGLESLVAGTCGLPRLLRTVGALSLFVANNEGASQISAEHVADAFAAQIGRAQLPAEKEMVDLERPGDDAGPSARSQWTSGELTITREAAQVESAVKVEGENFQPPLVPMPLVPMIRSSRQTASRRETIFRAKILGAIVLALLLLNGSLGDVGRTNPLLSARSSAADVMRALERVAKAEMPGPVILVLITVPPLQSLRIAPAKRKTTAADKQLDLATARQPARKTKPVR